MVLGDRPAEHGICQYGVGVIVVDGMGVLRSPDGGGWEAAREVGGDAYHDRLTVHVQVPCAKIAEGRQRRVADRLWTSWVAV